ncbi:heavy metal-associated isoprenylated plant protein 43-like isoform X3 [Diospyros lotus]|uniref:heavy metal-associated isoprenylated plant protein 43-like isoform X3 n=1 Tax=Diospyros lotus TaxID=55363 RepID=UPI0022595FCB|nr:heavy metal-associated isoprenylated plant protein 43-like isoform X3 [Diospyros lotus]
MHSFKFPSSLVHLFPCIFTLLQVTELKVCISCEKCKTQILKAVTKLEGIVEVSVDEQKEILKVVGDVDPIQVVKQVRKTGKTAVFGSVSESKPKPEAANPPKKNPPEKKQPEPGNPPPAPLPPYCSPCHLVEVRYEPYGGPYCSVM